ncbi:ribonuclease HII [Pontibacter sp. BT310]|uniref:Ribonuclease HII n=1 Tax=Pontibacter populi TaxID=890055 RepID=A0ABS6X9G3_9BACT|nr:MULTISPECIES: ribonuclease HII [Pontibacter]MBJ6116977.1 ribonuclease HII [Pontibacter sp. BT310]MBR0569401.1 ribonuclease HII [Microvirga sp. STS03]MBW3363830.1 ribonuclease HII [Pontibacter populi]
MLLSTFSGTVLEAGIDEAGRGCLAGPVVAAAVILPPDYKHQLLKDSKQLNKKQRELLRKDVLQDAVAWAVGEASPTEIDEINILQATFLAMHRAVAALTHTAEYLIVDGNRFKPYGIVPHTCIVKGDGKYLSIAAASVLAKTHRDDLMEQLALEFSMYGWERNAGYPTTEHRSAIATYGPTNHHRLSFTLLPEPLSAV